MDNSFEDLRSDIERQFIDKADDWKQYLVEINKSIVKFKPEITDDELYTFDTLCQNVLDAALDVTKTSSSTGTPLPPDQVLKEIYKRLVMNKVKGAKIEIQPKFKSN